MNRNRKYLKLAAVGLALIGLIQLSACGDDEVSSTSNNFDRTAMLSSLATNLIVPNFQALQTSVNQLSAEADEFSANATVANLQSLRLAWVQAVTDHQHCSAFGFGPASLPLGPYATVLGVFPVDEAQVEANMLNPDFNLEASFDRDVRGFFAIEYLIYGNGQSDEELVAAFDQNRIDYLLLLVDELKITFDNIVNEWNGGYFEEFTTDNSTSAGSAVSQLYNEFVKDYENLKNFKVELPAGLSAGQNSADGSLVEALYSGISRDLIVEHFNNSKNIYLGKSRSGTELTGFDEYLKSVEGGEALVISTQSAIDAIDNAITNLPQGRLSNNIEAQELVTLANLLQANTANFKSSMSSLLGISITFNSGDGD
ncbi:imelysin family protein [Fulvivirga lutea]|uniref:Imelysin family protein n=1 Tax=Fulvivirga lutea TaxID=2810512 RepID=A0A974WEY5_9BACT|nr:imelysin family protein [Fulvivirga lutea]QSE96203.1 imelysin family protein [Fulvivirga lutea]